jgi:hypothetical protein
MAQLSTKQYDDLERAVRDGKRVSVMRRGTEYIIVPQAVRVRSGKEAIEARNPTTGDSMVIFIDDIESFVVLPS